MKTVYKILILSLSILVIFLSCSKECDDCLEIENDDLVIITQ